MNAISEIRRRSAVRRRGVPDLLVHLRHSPGGLVGACILALFLILAIFGPSLPFIPDATSQNLEASLQPPVLAGGSWAHPLGTDALGRDVLGQVVAGARVSMEIGTAAVVISALVGVSVGMIAAYSGGILEVALMSIVDVFTALPGLLAGLLLVAVFGPGLGMVSFMLALSGWAVLARITRGYVATRRGELYVEASRLVGAPRRTVMRRHLLPNVTPSLVTLVVMEFAAAILAEAGYDFLGFGVQPPTTSWGLMISEGREYVTSAWWIITFAGLAIALLVFGANLLAIWIDSYSNVTARDQVLLRAEEQVP